jgi:hypothetical protein
VEAASTKPATAEAASTAAVEAASTAAVEAATAAAKAAAASIMGRACTFLGETLVGSRHRQSQGQNSGGT